MAPPYQSFPMQSAKFSKPGDAAFDCVEWASDMQNSFEPDKSPEPVTVKPQHVVAYTTVGSLVNSKAPTRFTAPNRIQRDGTTPKSLTNLLQSYDSGVLKNMQGPQGIQGVPISALNMANSMQYTQTIAAYSATPRVLQGSQHQSSFLNKPVVSNDEKGILVRQFGQMAPKPPGLGNYHPHPSSTMADKDLLENQNFDIRELSDHDLRARDRGSSISIRGLEKMQTIQHLANFENPSRVHAKDRLSELAVANQANINKHATAVPIGLPKKDSSGTITNSSSHLIAKSGNIQSRADSSHASYLQAANSQSSFDDIYGSQDQKRYTMSSAMGNAPGQLNHAYTFPPGLEYSVTTQSNPLFRAHTASSQSSSMPSAPPGYPKPLTAGPPGQRQYPPGLSAQSSFGAQRNTGNSFSQANAGTQQQQYAISSGQQNYNGQQFVGNSSDQINNGGYQQYQVHASAYEHSLFDYAYAAMYDQSDFSAFTSAHSSYEYAPDYSPWKTSESERQHWGGKNDQIIDTLPTGQLLKYFPKGLPSNVTGNWQPLSDRVKREMGLLPPLTHEEEEAERLEKLDDQFYYGQRRLFSMKNTDYLEELAAKTRNPFGPIAPPPKVENKKLTIDDMNKMSLSEAAAPFLRGTFGTLVSYLDHSKGAPRDLSGWEDSPDDYLDKSVDGNKTFFGEDWGRVPKCATSMGKQRFPSSTHSRSSQFERR